MKRARREREPRRIGNLVGLQEFCRAPAHRQVSSEGLATCGIQVELARAHCRISGVGIKTREDEGARASLGDPVGTADRAVNGKGVRRVIRPRLAGSQRHIGGDVAGRDGCVHGDAGGTGDRQRVAVGIEPEPVGGILDREALDGHIRSQRRGGRRSRRAVGGDEDIRSGARHEGLDGTTRRRRPVADRPVGGGPHIGRPGEAALPVGDGQRRGGGDAHLEIGSVAGECPHRIVSVVIDRAERIRRARPQRAACSNAVDQRVGASA